MRCHGCFLGVDLVDFLTRCLADRRFTSGVSEKLKNSQALSAAEGSGRAKLAPCSAQAGESSRAALGGRARVPVPTRARPHTRSKEALRGGVALPRAQPRAQPMIDTTARLPYRFALLGAATGKSGAADS